jgi:hypothetical protein
MPRRPPFDVSASPDWSTPVPFRCMGLTCVEQLVAGASDGR